MEKRAKGKSERSNKTTVKNTVANGQLRLRKELQGTKDGKIEVIRVSEVLKGRVTEKIKNM